MSNKLSHSSLTSFQDCPKKFEFRYVKRYYPITTSGALLFGSALDKSVENLLKTRDLQSSYETFERMWKEQEINKVPTQLAQSTKIVYANSDYDEELLDGEDFNKLSRYLELSTEQEVKEFLESIYKQKDVIGYENLSNERKRALNYANWLSLRHKGYLMLNAFNTHILPQIEEVLGTQVEINLENEDGDKIIGFADMVVRWKGIPEPVIFDLKTSTREYEDNAVLTSPQLTLYTHALSATYSTRRAGFLVLHKTIRKNKTKVCPVCGFDGTGTNFKTCNNTIDTGGKKPVRCNSPWDTTLNPEATFQVLINEIPERMEELVIENMELINECVKRGIFTRNLGSCVAKYGKCSYYEICMQNDLSQVMCAEKKD